MFIILMLFNNVQGILSLFNLKRLKCFDLPKFPKSCGKLTENMSSGKRRKQVTVHWVGQKVHSGFSTQCNGKPWTNSLASAIACPPRLDASALFWCGIFGSFLIYLPATHSMKPKVPGMVVKAFQTGPDLSFSLFSHLHLPLKLQPPWPPLCYLNTRSAYGFLCLHLLALGELLFILQGLQILPLWSLSLPSFGLINFAFQLCCRICHVV